MLLAVLRDLAAVADGAASVLLEPDQLARLGTAAPRLLGVNHDRPVLVDRLRRELVVFNRNPRLTVEGAVLAVAGALRAGDLPAS